MSVTACKIRCFITTVGCRQLSLWCVQVKLGDMRWCLHRLKVLVVWFGSGVYQFVALNRCLSLPFERPREKYWSFFWPHSIRSLFSHSGDIDDFFVPHIPKSHVLPVNRNSENLSHPKMTLATCAGNKGIQTDSIKHRYGLFLCWGSLFAKYYMMLLGKYYIY